MDYPYQDGNDCFVHWVLFCAHLLLAAKLRKKPFLPNISLLFVTEKQNKLDGARMRSVISETC